MPSPIYRIRQARCVCHLWRRITTCAIVWAFIPIRREKEARREGMNGNESIGVVFAAAVA